jgi:hypothetical protein
VSGEELEDLRHEERKTVQDIAYLRRKLKEVRREIKRAEERK